MMEEKSSISLHPPGIFRSSVKNPLLRLASKASMMMCDGGEKKEGEGGVPGGTAPYCPIFLPIDQDFKTKYMWHFKTKSRGRSVQERTYSFLEHPVGWLCFVYHMSV